MKTTTKFYPKPRHSQGLLPFLQKDKKYRYFTNDKENPLTHDIDKMITSLGPTSHPCTRKINQQQRVSLARKVQNSSNKVGKVSELPSHPLMMPDIKYLKQEIGKYVEKIGEAQSDGQGDYLQFVRLSRESQDYLEYYLKNHFKQTEVDVLKAADKTVILSLLKNNYPCLTRNPPDVSARILLGLGINPLNDFHLVPWTSFSLLRRLSSMKHSKSEGRKFLLNYLMAGRSKMSQQEFWGVVGGVFNKLRVVVGQNIQPLMTKMRELGSVWLGQILDRSAVQAALVGGLFFLSEEMIEIMFRF